MPEAGRVRVRMFGMLQTLQKSRGLPAEDEVEIPAEGLSGFALAEALDLPVERIEGVFCNHTIRPLDHVLKPGDEVAFVPHGTPGPHRFFLGLYAAGKESGEGDS